MGKTREAAHSEQELADAEAERLRLGVAWNSANHAFSHAFSLQPVQPCIQCLCSAFQIPLFFQVQVPN